MHLKTVQTQSLKPKLSTTLRSWLPILQANLENLKETLEPFALANPFIEIKSGSEKQEEKYSKKKNFFDKITKNSITDNIEVLSIAKKTLHETLFEQINPPLFPTNHSQKIAYAIIEYINHEGYFEPSSELFDKYNINEEDLEKVRKRFSHLEPVGIGAIDFKEAFLFQLDDLDIEPSLYLKAKELINNFENIEKFINKDGYYDVLGIIKKFKIPPAIEYFEEQSQIIPDIFVFESKGAIEVKINTAFYPEILLDTEGIDEAHEFISKKIKDAKDLIDALEMRKATLYKIGLMIVEYQYDFFFGGSIKPMRLKDIAKDLQRNPSTVSRAISNKYLSCNRGIIPLKKFLATQIEEDVSNSAIKEYLCQLVKNEDRKKPLSDVKLLFNIEKNFNIKIVRRTITKYRNQLNIAGSSERKKLYALKNEV